MKTKNFMAMSFLACTLMPLGAGTIQASYTQINSITEIDQETPLPKGQISTYETNYLNAEKAFEEKKDASCLDKKEFALPEVLYRILRQQDLNYSRPLALKLMQSKNLVNHIMYDTVARPGEVFSELYKSKSLDQFIDTTAELAALGYLEGIRSWYAAIEYAYHKPRNDGQQNLKEAERNNKCQQTFKKLAAITFEKPTFSEKMVMEQVQYVLAKAKIWGYFGFPKEYTNEMADLYTQSKNQFERAWRAQNNFRLENLSDAEKNEAAKFKRQIEGLDRYGHAYKDLFPWRKNAEKALKNLILYVDVLKKLASA